jgi:tetratricopeptide (TPR) repeat protein
MAAAIHSAGGSAVTGVGRLGTILTAVLPALAFVLLYAPTLDDGLVWTDETAIGAGTVLRPAGETLDAFREPLHRIDYPGAGAQQRYYRPLAVVVLSLTDQWTGRDTRAFRVAVLGVGALCVAVFGVFAGSLLGSAGAGVFAGLFAAVHPAGIESTAWILGMPEALSALFVVAALGLALASRPPRTAAEQAGLAALSLLALALGLLAKERASVTPALLAVGFVCLGARGAVRWATALVAAQVALVAAYLYWLRPLVLGSALLPLPPIGGSAFTQVLTGVASWPGQLGWLLAPVTSSTSDTVQVVRSLADPRPWLGAAVALASVLGFWILRRTDQRLGAFGLAWVWIAFAPSAGLVPMLHPSGERYLYLSVFGVALLAADLGRALARRAPEPRGRWLAAGLAGLVLLGLAQRTRARLPDWESTEALFTADVARDPAYREAYFLLAAEDFEAGEYARAAAHLGALLGPGDAFAGTAGYLNWTVVAELACRNELALGRYERVDAIEEKLRREEPQATRVPGFQICQGQALDARGGTEAALQLYLAAARQLGPATPPALAFLIARNASQLGRRSEALDWIGRAEAGEGADPALRRQIEQLAASLRRSP